MGIFVLLAIWIVHTFGPGWGLVILLCLGAMTAWMMLMGFILLCVALVPQE